MTVSRKSSGVWVAYTPKRKSGGVMTAPAAIRRKTGGVWVNAWPSVLTVSPTSVNKAGARGNLLSQALSFSESITSGTWISGGTGISVTGSGASRTMSSQIAAGTESVTYTGTMRFTGASGQTVDVPATFEHIGSG